MNVKKISPLFIFIFLVFSPVVKALEEMKKPDEVTVEVEELQEKFKETAFLQIDALDVPAELLRIEEQLKQNAIDVIITSRTHTPVFAQKQPNGYSESYKKFNGLKIQIVPIPNEADFYSLTLDYYNWTTRKYDKKLRKRISKYNVLNEMRFATYEILLGESFVKRNYDKLEKLNFQRIQAIRKFVEQQERDARKKKKEDKKKQKKLEEQLEAESKKKNNPQSKLNRGEEADPPQKSKKSRESDSEDIAAKRAADLDVEAGDSEQSSFGKIADTDVPEVQLARTKKSKSNDIEEVDQKDSKQKTQDDSKSPEKPKALEKEKVTPPESLPDAPIPPVAIPEKGVKVVSDAYVHGSFFGDNTVAHGLVRTSTYLKYAGVGATYSNTVLDEHERGYRVSLRVGVPLRKKNYKFPVYRAVETEFTRKVYKNFQGIVGIDYVPLHFLGLPKLNEGFQIYENEFYCIKFGVGITPEFLKNVLSFRLLLLKSLLSKSNQPQELNETSVLFNTVLNYSAGHGFDLTYQKRFFSGDMKVETERYAFSYIYRFKD